MWQFLGCPACPPIEWPQEMSPAMSTHLGYHRRPFEHGIATYDWQCYLAFTDQAFHTTIDWQAAKTDVWHGFSPSLRGGRMRLLGGRSRESASRESLGLVYGMAGSLYRANRHGEAAGRGVLPHPHEGRHYVVGQARPL